LLSQDIAGIIEAKESGMRDVETKRRKDGAGAGSWTIFVSLSLLLFVSLAACQSAPKAVPYARPYPDLKQSEVLNIQVFRRTKTVEFTNTTARAFGPSTIWLNARFCCPIDGLAVGQSRTMAMKDFRDQFYDEFRGGGFFATEPPERLVLAQIQTKDQDGKDLLLGMVVIGGEAE
jgi:hypothetical protein